MEPGFSGWPGGLPTSAVVSVWPKPSRTVVANAISISRSNPS